MKPLTTVLALCGLITAVAACNGNSNPLSLSYKPESKDDLLADSGFKVYSLNTPAKVAAFKKLPAHRLTQTTFKGRQVWVYPDRNVCGCLYIGSQQAYQTFLKKGREQMVDTAANRMYDPDPGDPYNPTATMASLDWGDAWDDADAYGLYIN
ncbi:hypothetical protein [Reyranella sp.]|uniref:hypothetical protein n=1 Tax=Reyranella sp. TaxID=1929291 RepID=UPI003BA92D2A